jgi:hypothetical protein
LNIGEAQDVRTLIRTLGTPGTTDPERVIAALGNLAQRAGKALGVDVPDAELHTAAERLRALALDEAGPVAPSGPPLAPRPRVDRRQRFRQ